MSKAGRHNTNKTLFGNKLTNIRGEQKMTDFAKYFQKSATALASYLKGESSPSIAQVWEFVLRYAADNNMQLIDLNWLVNDNDRRLGPVFLGKSVDESLAFIKNHTEEPSKYPDTNALRLRSYDREEGDTRHFRVVGEAAAFEGNGSRIGGFAEDDHSIWDDIEIPGETYFVRAIGDSMSPVILNGQYAMVGSEYMRDATPKDGEIVVAEVMLDNDDASSVDAPWEGVYVKRVFDVESTWLFRSINPAFQDFTIHKNSCRLWPVIGVYFAGKGKIPED